MDLPPCAIYICTRLLDFPYYSLVLKILLHCFSFPISHYNRNIQIVLGNTVELLSLGAHAQRGLQYSVCLFVCLSVTTLRSTPLAFHIKVWCQQVTNGVFYSLYGRIFVKRITSRAMQLFAFLDCPWRYLREVCTAKDSLQCC